VSRTTNKKAGKIEMMIQHPAGKLLAHEAKTVTPKTRTFDVLERPRKPIQRLGDLNLRPEDRALERTSNGYQG
jgi:hypothetical protein